MNCAEINYDDVCVHIPHVIQSLYRPEILNSTTLIEMRDAFRINQMQGKAWLLDNIKKVDRNIKVLVVGSWMGFTSYCLYKEGFTDITETDIDARLQNMAQYINMSNPSFQHLNTDVNELDLSDYGLIINTSCEHISNNSWFDNVAPGTILALQSTNFKCDTHVNTVTDLAEMKHKYPFKYTYADELVFNSAFTRYMLVGEKT
jgi:hypothetical protein